ncbi:MAG: sigma-54-dependent transcriptional regulator [Myxococcota bacterium]
MSEIVLVEDEEVLRRSLAKTLERLGHRVRAVETAEQGFELIERGLPDLLLTDHRLPGMSGYELLRRVKEEHASVAVIVLTAHGTIEDAVAAMRSGAADYLRKPIDLQELCVVVQRCLEREGLRRELDYYRTRELGTGRMAGIVGSSEAMGRLRGIIKRVASLEKREGGGPTILLSGETGTGKGLAARAIHNASPHRDAPFIEVNCTAIPENLLEAELMGYEKGAFTGAAAAKPGLFEAAEGGTIFFDEIGHMSLQLQAKLLKVIDEKTVRRIGSMRDRVMSCTVLTATHMDLARRVNEDRFLEDLYHRINVVRIEIPPLRDREDDVVQLADHFLRLHASEYGVEMPQLTPRALDAIRSYPWPGNVRELSHAIERAIVLCPEGVLDVGDLALESAPSPGAAVRVDATNGIDVDFSRGAIRLEEVETGLIRCAMEFTHGNQVQAARLLGVSRDALRYRLEKYGLR